MRRDMLSGDVKSIRSLRWWRRELLAKEVTDDFDLCYKVGMTKDEIIGLAGEAVGNQRKWCELLGYSYQSRNHIVYLDDHYWKTILAYVKIFIPRYEKEFRQQIRRYMNAITLPDEQEVLNSVCTFLGISPELVQLYANNSVEIDNFLLNNRRMLGIIAEKHLWSIIAEGKDATTIRWALEKLKPDVYGKEMSVTDNLRKITIIESE